MNIISQAESGEHATDRLRRLTQEILECARKGDWDNTIRIEAERRPLLRLVFATPTPDPKLKPLLEEILTADQEIVTLTQHRHNELAGQVRQMGRGRTALRAYDRNSR